MERKQVPKIEAGYRIGKLTVAESTKERKNGYTICCCDCDCGGSILLDTRTLQRGIVQDCGCETVVKPGQRDITGLRFGKLIAEYPVDGGGYGETIWHCRCDCGGEVDAPLHQLTAGYRKSCGCLSHPPLKDFIGKRFGRLTVTEYAGKRAGMHRWKCVCDCGKETVVGQTLLQSGKTRSCGCLSVEHVSENMKCIDGTSVVILESLQGKLRSNNTSGYTGVYQDSKSHRWYATITFKGKVYHLGTFTTREEAIKARMKGEEMHKNFIKWYYSEYIQQKP